MRLFGTERLALRVQRHCAARKRSQVREPPLCLGWGGGDHDEDPLGKTARECGQEQSRTRAREAADGETAARRWEALRQCPCRRQRVHLINQEIERHQCVRVATPSSTRAGKSARARRKVLKSRRPAPAKLPPVQEDRKTKGRNPSNTTTPNPAFCL